MGAHSINGVEAYLQPLVSCYLYKTIMRQRKKDIGEIEKIKKIQLKEYLYED